jgi:hypothetical protein
MRRKELGKNNNRLINRIVTKFVSPNPAGLLVMLIVSEKLTVLKVLMIHKSMIHKHLRQIVTYGILGVWTTAIS